MKTLLKLSFIVTIIFAFTSCSGKTEKECANCDSTNVVCDSICADSAKVDSVTSVIDSIQP